MEQDNNIITASIEAESVSAHTKEKKVSGFKKRFGKKKRKSATSVLHLGTWHNLLRIQRILLSLPIVPVFHIYSSIFYVSFQFFLLPTNVLIIHRIYEQTMSNILIRLSFYKFLTSSYSFLSVNAVKYSKLPLGIKEISPCPYAVSQY